MNCKKCKSAHVLVESTGNGGSKRVCQACGFCEVVNREGKMLLTDDMPAPRGPSRLEEG